ncbi:MAG: TraR/DksA C4-type zinc finger protein [Prosthecobacter sp.]|nr:TraR/DksA C4-type zinc finger protein [Prosthecobacter sp.]
MITSDQMFYFEDKIDALIQQLQAEIAKAAEDTAAVSPDNAIGRISRMDSILSQEVAKAAVARKQQRILDLHAARMRLDEGKFGWCVVCVEDIEIERLEAAPEATLCLACSAKPLR